MAELGVQLMEQFVAEGILQMLAKKGWAGSSKLNDIT
jgi:hypothetical protein